MISRTDFLYNFKNTNIKKNAATQEMFFKDYLSASISLVGGKQL